MLLPCLHSFYSLTHFHCHFQILLPIHVYHSTSNIHPLTSSPLWKIKSHPYFSVPSPSTAILLAIGSAKIKYCRTKCPVELPTLVDGSFLAEPHQQIRPAGQLRRCFCLHSHRHYLTLQDVWLLLSLQTDCRWILNHAQAVALTYMDSDGYWLFFLSFQNHKVAFSLLTFI